jgi:UDP-N-acetylmuramoylalanine--D-glutamate ligase
MIGTATALAGKRVTVMGLGLFSGGVETVKFLVSHGAKVTVTDTRDENALVSSLSQLSGLSVTFKLGRHEEKDFTNTDLLIVNPAVPLGSPFERVCASAGVPVTTEINLFFQLCRAPIIAVTGTNGKTTTAYIIGEILRRGGLPRRGSLHFGGNMGKSLIAQVEEILPQDLVVLEISSSQLARLRWVKKSPRIAVATNITPNHLDWHKTMEEYELAKRAIVDYQSESDYAVLNKSDLGLASWARNCRSRILWFSSRDVVQEGACLEGEDLVLRRNGRSSVVCARRDVRLPGLFNVENYLAAFCAASILGASPENCAEVARTFAGVEHRLEFVRTVRGVRCYNDSIATNPESTIAALSAIDSPIVLVAGGSDKNLSYDAVGKEIAKRTKAVVLVGATASKIEESVRAGGMSEGIHNERNFEDAVRRAFSLATEGDTVLLSPASASFDMFANFEHRGKTFKEIVAQLAKESDQR